MRGLVGGVVPSLNLLTINSRSVWISLVSYGFPSGRHISASLLCRVLIINSASFALCLLVLWTSEPIARCSSETLLGCLSGMCWLFGLKMCQLLRFYARFTRILEMFSGSVRQNLGKYNLVWLGTSPALFSIFIGLFCLFPVWFYLGSITTLFFVSYVIFCYGT